MSSTDTVSHYKFRDYDPEIITLRSDNAPDIDKLKQDIQNFIKANGAHWSGASIAQMLGIDLYTVRQLAGDTNIGGADLYQTVIVLKPIEEADEDQLQFSLGRI
jgi:hypothetical protein